MAAAVPIVVPTVAEAAAEFGYLHHLEHPPLRRERRHRRARLRPLTTRPPAHCPFRAHLVCLLWVPNTVSPYATWGYS